MAKDALTVLSGGSKLAPADLSSFAATRVTRPRGGNGCEAVKLYRRHQPDVVIMDLRVPVLGGVDAISMIIAEYLKGTFP